MDGSRRVSLRNRRFLRKILPICRKCPESSFDRGVPVPPVAVPTDTTNVLPPQPVSDPSEPVPSLIANPEQNTSEGTPDVHPLRVEPSSGPSPALPTLRRSSRGCVPRTMFSAKLSGKTHDVTVVDP